MRTMPPVGDLFSGTGDAAEWLGRAQAVLGAWDANAPRLFVPYLAKLRLANVESTSAGYADIAALLHRARYALRMETVGPLSVAVGTGNVFDYFDEVRKVIEAAATDLLFVDPYLDAEFVSRYLPHVVKVPVRLLAREKVGALLPAVEAFAAQNGANVQVRSANGFHDRFVFVDQKVCYQSGASFKDGAKKAPTTLTQVTDAFGAMLQTYEGLWAGGKVLR